ncbi:ATP-binding cassette domain-containing protein [Corynebacterium sp. ED61]|nr:ATP-binding cassette domain-containing protein [Corynebacterium sp. ED61]
MPLDGATATLPGGRVYGLIGRNGAGKTTLLRAKAGHVRVKGKLWWTGSRSGTTRRCWIASFWLVRTCRGLPRSRLRSCCPWPPWMRNWAGWVVVLLLFFPTPLPPASAESPWIWLWRPLVRQSQPDTCATCSRARACGCTLRTWSRRYLRLLATTFTPPRRS